MENPEELERMTPLDRMSFFNETINRLRNSQDPDKLPRLKAHLLSVAAFLSDEEFAQVAQEGTEEEIISALELALNSLSDSEILGDNP